MPKDLELIDMDPTEYPFLIQMISNDTGEIVFTQVVPGPGAIRVPSNNELGGRPIDVRMLMPNGKWYMQTHDGKLSSGGYS